MRIASKNLLLRRGVHGGHEETVLVSVQLSIVTDKTKKRPESRFELNFKKCFLIYYFCPYLMFSSWYNPIYILSIVKDKM